MTEREKIYSGLAACTDVYAACKDCPYRDQRRCQYLLMDDVLNLLKEQEPRAPHYTRLQYSINGIVHEIKHPECPRCFENGLDLWAAEIERGQAYCKRCGQKVVWDND